MFLRNLATAALIAIALVAGVAVGAPAPGSVRDALPDGVVADWTAGRLTAVGAAAADLRAPNPDVARVTATRAASERAGEALERAARKLPLAAGGTLGERAEKDEAVDARVKAALGRARVIEANYSSDGGARVTLSVPLWSLWLAAAGPVSAPAADAAAPTAIVVDARKLKMKPVLGLGVGTGMPPVVWTTDAEWNDARSGARIEKVNAIGMKGGVLEVKLDDAAVATALAAGTLFVVVIGGGEK